MLTGLLAQTTKLPTVAPRPGTFWMPEAASSAAEHVDTAFYFIYWVSVFFFILIVALMVFFVVRYRRRVEGEGPRTNISHNTPLEITWTAIPLVLVVIMFYLGFRGFIDVVNAPVDAMDVYVTGAKWNWSFEYPNGHIDTDLHLPVDQPVQLILNSVDVIHSFYVPAFRIKRDAVPGRYNKIWFKPTKAGEYLALCAEYCGTKHSEMLARVVVHEPGGFEAWMAEAANPFRTRSMPEVGAMIVAKRCSGCHSVDGTANVGPTFKNIFGHEVKLKDGSTVTVDQNYIRNSILNPAADVVAGFEPVMPTFRGQLKDREITAIIEYMKELAGIKSQFTTPDEAAEKEGGKAETRPAEAGTQPAEGGATPPDENTSVSTKSEP